ncbi:MAG TPA: cytidine deaminase [Candidatus Cloacimonetes bacterium]|nr:cytidine deaminase [Candidatus Cloacimonadota bacterium]HEX38352.1 cytidine deaminase [Candidatus Cloacimonadota bacterium]
MDIKDLIIRAREASDNSYSLYSNYKVGAALSTTDGEIFTGTNIENASFPASVCAERVAIFEAVKKGKKNFEALAIYAEGENYPFPCGICRQVMTEFSRDMKVIVARNEYDYVVKTIAELLPDMFEFSG